MSRPRTQIHPHLPYAISSRCINRDWFSVPMLEVWEIFAAQLFFVSHAYQLKIHAFVLMNNHYHLIATSPQANLSAAISWLNRETSRALTRTSDRINQTYGGRYHKTALGSHHYFLNAYKYLYANPVKAGICQRAELYPYSSLPGVLGMQRLSFPVIEDLTLFSDVEGTLAWINRPCKEKDWDFVKNALRRPDFWLAKVKGKPNSLESDTL